MFSVSFQMIVQLIHLFVQVSVIMENVLLLDIHGFYCKMKTSNYLQSHICHESLRIVQSSF